MSNQNFKKINHVRFDMWLNKHSKLKQGFISVYDNEDFDPDINSSAYEIGRQMAIMAKTLGYKTKGGLIRRKPNSSEFAWVKTKVKELEHIARSLGYHPKQMTIRNVA